MTDQEKKQDTTESSAAAEAGPETVVIETQAKAGETGTDPQEATASDAADEQGQPAGDQADRFKDVTDNLKETTEKLWENTRHAWSTATFKAQQYKLLVQKKIDLSAIHKRISASHGDLGRLIDDLRGQGQERPTETPEVQSLFDRLDGLKAEAAMLEEEIDALRHTEKPADE
ncbi:MAG: hypothetical protein RQ723_10120 [Desulfuromonadales bacterium]|nr:hypothetical protein [Desulfuromonadales bacterium]